MVFDAVASRRRNYEQKVLPWVQTFQSEAAAGSLSALAELGPSSSFHLMTGESDTMREVASGLMRFASDHGHRDDDSAVEAWAALVRPLEVAPALDTYVGAVKGIGIALFCYLRMRAGADAIKPDTRVRASLQRLGFTLPENDAAALLVTASVLANELGINRLVLDQLLWTAAG